MFVEPLLEKKVHLDKGDSLIAIDKWMVLEDMESVGSGFIEDVLWRNLPPTAIFSWARAESRRLAS